MVAQIGEYPATQGCRIGKDLREEVGIVDGVIERREIFRCVDLIGWRAVVGEENAQYARGYFLEHFRPGDVVFRVECERLFTSVAPPRSEPERLA